MLRVEEILARLQNGENINTIANEMTETLNAANEKFQKEQKEKTEQKLQDLQTILDLIHDFCIDYYCDNEVDIDTVHAVFSDLDAEKVNKMIEEASAETLKMQQYIEHLFTAPTKSKSSDSIINNFLKSIGL